MEGNTSSTALIDISRYCSSFADGDLWSSSQSSCSRSPVQRLFSPTPTRSSDSDSPVLPSLPLPPAGWSLSSSFANIDLDPPLSTTSSSSSSMWPSSQHHACNCCPCVNKTESWSELFQNRIRARPRLHKDDKSTANASPMAIQRPSPARTTISSASLAIFDDELADDETLRLHVSNIPFTWSKEKLADVFGKYGTTFDVEVVYNERGSKGFGFVTFLAKKDALEAKRRMDREIVDGRRLVVNFAKPKQKAVGPAKDHSPMPSNSSINPGTWKAAGSADRSQRVNGNHHHQQQQQQQPLGFSTPPTARRQHLSGFSSLSCTPTRSSTSNNYHRYYL